jgi:hypothetical protein
MIVRGTSSFAGVEVADPQFGHRGAVIADKDVATGA